MKKNIIIAVLILLLIGVAAAFIHNKLNKKVEYIDKIVTKEKPVFRVDTFHVTHATIKDETVPIVVTKFLPYVNDTLLPALNIAANQINELTEIKATLEGELKAARVKIDELGYTSTLYKNKYMEILTNSKDSTAKYRYNAQIDVLNYQKKKPLFGRDINFVDVSSPDSNFRVNGLTHYRKDIKLKKDNVAISLDNQLNIGAKSQTLNNVQSAIRFDINPDGFLQPYFGYGYYYNMYSGGEIKPFGTLGLKLNFLRF